MTSPITDKNTSSSSSNVDAYNNTMLGVDVYRAAHTEVVKRIAGSLLQDPSPMDGIFNKAMNGIGKKNEIIIAMAGNYATAVHNEEPNPLSFAAVQSGVQIGISSMAPNLMFASDIATAVDFDSEGPLKKAIEDLQKPGTVFDRIVRDDRAQDAMLVHTVNTALQAPAKIRDHVADSFARYDSEGPLKKAIEDLQKPGTVFEHMIRGDIVQDKMLVHILNSTLKSPAKIRDNDLADPIARKLTQSTSSCSTTSPPKAPLFPLSNHTISLLNSNIEEREQGDYLSSAAFSTIVNPMGGNSERSAFVQANPFASTSSSTNKSSTSSSASSGGGRFSLASTCSSANFYADIPLSATGHPEETSDKPKPFTYKPSENVAPMESIRNLPQIDLSIKPNENSSDNINWTAAGVAATVVVADTAVKVTAGVTLTEGGLGFAAGVSLPVSGPVLAGIAATTAAGVAGIEGYKYFERRAYDNHRKELVKECQNEIYADITQRDGITAADGHIISFDHLTEEARSELNHKLDEYASINAAVKQKEEYVQSSKKPLSRLFGGDTVKGARDKLALEKIAQEKLQDIIEFSRDPKNRKPAPALSREKSESKHKPSESAQPEPQPQPEAPPSQEPQPDLGRRPVPRPSLPLLQSRTPISRESFKFDRNTRDTQEGWAPVPDQRFAFVQPSFKFDRNTQEGWAPVPDQRFAFVQPSFTFDRNTQEGWASVPDQRFAFAQPSFIFDRNTPPQLPTPYPAESPALQLQAQSEPHQTIISDDLAQSLLWESPRSGGHSFVADAVETVAKKVTEEVVEQIFQLVTFSVRTIGHALLDYNAEKRLAHRNALPYLEHSMQWAQYNWNSRFLDVVPRQRLNSGIQLVREMEQLFQRESSLNDNSPAADFNVNTEVFADLDQDTKYTPQFILDAQAISKRLSNASLLLSQQLYRKGSSILAAKKKVALVKWKCSAAALLDRYALRLEAYLRANREIWRLKFNTPQLEHYPNSIITTHRLLEQSQNNLRQEEQALTNSLFYWRIFSDAGKYQKEINAHKKAIHSLIRAMHTFLVAEQILKDKAVYDDQTEIGAYVRGFVADVQAIFKEGCVLGHKEKLQAVYLKYAPLLLMYQRASFFPHEHEHTEDLIPHQLLFKLDDRENRQRMHKELWLPGLALDNMKNMLLVDINSIENHTLTLATALTMRAVSRQNSPQFGTPPQDSKAS